MSETRYLKDHTRERKSVRINSRSSYIDQRLISISQGRSLPSRALRLLVKQQPGLVELACNLVRRFIDTRTLCYLSVALLWSRGELKGLANECRSAIYKYPEQPYFRRMYAELMYQSDEMERGLSILGPEQAESESLYTLLLRIRLHRRRDELDRALRLAETACRRFPEASMPLLVLGQMLAISGRHDEASKWFSRGMTLFPETLKFPELLSGIYKRAGDEAASIQLDIACLEIAPNSRTALKSLTHSLQTTGVRPPEALTYLDVYEEKAKLKPADYLVLRRIAALKGTEIDPVALEKIAYSETPKSGDPFDRLLALASLEDFGEAAIYLTASIARGHWDQRFIAYLKIYGKYFLSIPAQPHLPALDFIAEKLRIVAHGDITREFGQYLDGTIVNRVLESRFPEELRPLVSYICPIHRKQDVRNLLLQIQHQDWQKAEVVFCINSPEIKEVDLEFNIGCQYTSRIIRCNPGKTVGYYLNRCVDESTGEVIMRLDADDLYAPGYTSYMTRFMREVGSEIVCMDLCTVYFDNLDQTYLKRPLMPPPLAASGYVDEDTLGSGSSLCARREVFDKVRFDESLNSGEDTQFYRAAAAFGLAIHMVPSFFHTVFRHADKTLHTWRWDDFDILSEHSVFFGDGAITPEPGVLPQVSDSGDPFARLFSDSKISWMRELGIESTLRSAVERVTLLVGRYTPIAECESNVLQVARIGASTVNDDSKVLVFIPEDPDLEESAARDLSAISLIHDLMPELIVGNQLDVKAPFVLEPCKRGNTELRFSKTTSKYVILCNPRAGSEYLCGLLHSMGMGSPRELLREPMANVLIRSSNPSAYLLNVFARHAGEGVFGTKIVSQFLFEQPEQEWVFDIMNWMVDNSFHFVKLTRPIEHSAVSAYIAEKRGIWHHRERPIKYLDRGRPVNQNNLPPYDFHAISNVLERFVDFTAQLDEVISEVVPHKRLLEVNYTDLCAAPQSTTENIADFIGFRPLPKSLAISDTRPISDEFHELKDYQKRFEKDWLAAH